jgi:hypothetical protein
MEEITSIQMLCEMNLRKGVVYTLVTMEITSEQKYRKPLISGHFYIVVVNLKTFSNQCRVFFKNGSAACV